VQVRRGALTVLPLYPGVSVLCARKLLTSPEPASCAASPSPP